MIAVAVFSGLFNTVLAKRLPIVETIVLVIHFGGFFGYFIALWVCSSGKRASPSQVFTSFENSGGWSNQGIATLIGTTGALFSLIGPDSAVHMAGTNLIAQNVPSLTSPPLTLLPRGSQRRLPNDPSSHDLGHGLQRYHGLHNGHHLRLLYPLR